MKLSLILCVLVIILISGCITTDIPTGNAEAYELPGLNNTTIFYLNLSSVQVVDNVINETTIRFVLEDGGEMSFRNPVAIDHSGKNVSFTTSKEPILGKSYIKFSFESPFSGFVAYTQSDGQDFSRMLTKNGSVRVVLPLNYTTGSRLFGIAQPEPYNTTVDAKGRDVLIWENPYPAHQKIEVKYYHESAPYILFYIVIFLLFCAFVIFGYYYFSLRSLKKKWEMVEKGLKK